MNTMVNNGEVLTMKLTLLTYVIPTARFSVMKYSDPPVIPNANIISSSRQLSDHTFRVENGRMAT